jgi:hypothetical protein
MGGGVAIPHARVEHLAKPLEFSLGFGSRLILMQLTISRWISSSCFSCRRLRQLNSSVPSRLWREG